jgi:hypothetical protein
MRIELSGPAKQKIDRLSDHHGMTQLSIMSRMVEWFAAQSPGTQGAILSGRPGDREPALMALRRMAGEG